jgi:hypothetical protein
MVNVYCVPAVNGVVLLICMHAFSPLGIVLLEGVNDVHTTLMFAGWLSILTLLITIDGIPAFVTLM